jgi:nucleotide-binding universal stress UspA family protein
MIPRRILVPVTLTRETAEVAAGAATLAAAVHAELLLLGIAPTATDQRALDQLIAVRLQELADALPPGAGARVLLTRGAVGPALAATARDRQADLVVLPVRRDDGAHTYVLRHAAVPLLLVPSGRA